MDRLVDITPIGSEYRQWAKTAPELKRETVTPLGITATIGALEIRSTGSGPRGGHGVEVLIAGKPVAVRSLTIHIRTDDVVRCEMEWFP